MPDIVLKDSSGNTQTFTGATGLGVDTVDGGVAVFVSEDLIPEGYTHPATHPASMITDLAPVATGGKFADLWQKPVYELPRLDSTELAFNVDELCCFCQLSGKWEIPLGETYKITWDGQEYTCVCKDVSEIGEANISGISYLGNSAKLFGMGWGTDTGEPFIIGFNTQLDSDEYGNAAIMTTDMSETHTVSIAPVNSVKKLDEKYLPDTAATKKFVQEEIAKIEVSGGSGGTAVTETDILPETDATFSNDLSYYPGLYAALCSGTQALIEGAEYIVVWDGAEYTVTGIFYQELGDVGIGNPAILSIGDDTNEPFAVGVAGSDESGNVTLAVFSGDTETTHTIRIYQEADLTVSWDNVTDKPFYEETHSVTADSTTVKEDVTFEGLGYSWVKVTDETLPKGTVIGAIVTGVSAGSTVRIEVTQDTVIVDNDNGIGCILAGQVPFLMVYIPGEITISALGATETVNIPETGTYMLNGFADGESFTMESKSAKKIDDKFQHQTDWEEDSDESAAFMRNKPFGVFLSVGDVVVDHDALYEPLDLGLMLFDINTGATFVNRDKIKVGVTYDVQCGEYSYTGVGISDSEVYDLIGAESLGGIKIMDNTNTQVATLIAGLQGIVDCIAFMDSSIFEDGSTYSVKVTVAEEVVKTIDPKYIPGPPEFDLTAMGLPTIDLDGIYVSVETDTSAIKNAASCGLVKLRNNLDGIENETICAMTSIQDGVVYSYATIVVLNNAPFVVEFVVTDTAIMARAIQIALPTTS